jgi:hypothetical protein
VQWSRSPDGARLALVGERPNRGEALIVVDAETLRTLGTASLFGDLRLSGPRAVAWVEAGLLVVTSDLGRVAIHLVDPDALTARRLVTLPGEAVATAAGDHGVVALVAPAGRIGAVRLVSIGAGLARRVVPLSIRGGTTTPTAGASPESFVATMRQPALAVDPAGTRAVVAGYAEPIAEVDLVRGTVRSHRVPVRIPAKAVTGPTLVGTWLGPDTVAVTGMHFGAGRNGARAKPHPFGLQLLDLRTWRFRAVDAEVAWLTAERPYLLVQGSRRGIRWYAPTGRRVGSLFPGAEVADVAPAGDRALVRLVGDPRVALVDLATGRVLERRSSPEASLPLFLAGRHGP